MRILLNFGSQSGRENRFRVALTLARTLGADLRCVYAVGPAHLPFVASERTLSDAEVKEMLNEPDTSRVEARTQFEALSLQCGVPTMWHEFPGPAHELVVRSARYADCAVVEQARRGGLSDRDVFDIVLGCPAGVVVLPDGLRPDHEFGTALLAWNASRQSARAMHESLPLLERAKEVVLVTADEGSARPGDREDIEQLLDFLSAHGTNARPVSLESEPQDMGKALLGAAHEHSADLLVMGAFGHSRAFEYWLGGATRDVLQHTNVPVFMAH